MNLEKEDDTKPAPKKFIIALACWITGIFGVHRFLLGYSNWWVQLITFGGCGLWTFVDLIRILTDKLPTSDGKDLTKSQYDKPVTGIIVAFLLFSFLFGDNSKTSTTTSSSSTSYSKKEVKIDSYQLLSLIKGCCSSVSGTYSPAGQDCIINNWDKRELFISCIGEGTVIHRSGNEESYYGESFIR
jgi:hypothetical protein